MVRRQSSRRAVLALAGASLCTGCLGGISRSSLADSLSGSNADDSTTPPADGPVAPEGSWPAIGRDAGHTGYNSTIGAEKPTDRWTEQFDGPATTPTVVDGTVYLARGAYDQSAKLTRVTLDALSLDSGEKLWERSWASIRGYGPIPADGAYVLTTQRAPKNGRSRTRPTAVGTTGRPCGRSTPDSPYPCRDGGMSGSKSTASTAMSRTPSTFSSSVTLM